MLSVVIVLCLLVLIAVAVLSTSNLRVIEKPTVTLVTAFFPVAKAKHSSSDYEKWFKHFFSQVTTPIILFTTPDMAPLFIKLRKELPMVVDIRYETVWQIPFATNIQNQYSQQRALDRESNIHSPELYAVWNAKMYLLHTAAHWNPYASDHFFWVDSGSFREKHPYRHWPDKHRVRDVLAGRGDKILVHAVNDPRRLQNFDGGVPIDEDIIAGGFFGGTIMAIDWFFGEYYQFHDSLMKQGLFVGKEQSLLNAVCAKNRARMIFTDTAQACPARINPWFYFQPFLAHASERPV